MKYKPDWEAAQRRWLAWWRGEVVDRCVVLVYAPRRGVEQKTPWTGWELVNNLDGIDAVLETFERHVAETFYGGEAFPSLFLNLGPGSLAAYLGCDPDIKPDTVWYEKTPPMELRDIAALPFDRSNYYWKKTLEITEKAGRHGQGKYFPGATDLNSAANVIGAFRGTQTLLYDLMDDPDLVKQAIRSVTDHWIAAFEEQYRLAQKYNAGSSNWMELWFPGKGTDVQCDFAAMIGPQMMEEFILPDLQRQCRALEQTIYHLDGPGQLPHLDLLLGIPELHGIQWAPGPAEDDCASEKWFPLYARIQEKRKLLVLQSVPPEKVENLVRSLSSKGLLIQTRCSSQDEAEDLLAKVHAWTHD